MRLKFDPDYVIGALVLAVLGALFVSALLWIGSSEIAYWRNPHHGDYFGYHTRAFMRLAGVLIVATVWAFNRWKRRKKDR